MNSCCEMCCMRKPWTHNRFFRLLPGILGMHLYHFDQTFPKGYFLSFKGQMIFKKHLDASLNDTNENTFQFHLTEIKINLNL